MKDLLKYAKSLLIDAHSDLDKAIGDNNKKALHLFRLDVKKITALEELLSFCYDTKILTDKKLNKLFKLCGKVRESNTHLMNINKYLNIKNKEAITLKKALKKKVKNHYTKLSDQYKKKNEKVFIKTNQWINKTLKNPARHKLQDYFLMKQKKILGLLLQLPGNNEHIHNFRKEIKSYIHNTEGLYHLKPYHLINLKILQKWDTILGDWCDAIKSTEEIEKLLNKFRKDKKLYTAMQKLKINLISERNTLLKKFLTQADSQLLILMNRGTRV